MLKSVLWLWLPLAVLPLMTMSTYSIWLPFRFQLFKPGIANALFLGLFWWPVSKFQMKFGRFQYILQSYCRHMHTQKEQSYTLYKCTWQTVWKQNGRHGLTHAVRWFLEIRLTQLHIRTADSCSWTSQDSELGGRIIEGPEAISCQDRRPLQSDRAKSRKWFILSWLRLGLPVKWWLMFCLFLFFSFPAYSPASKTKMDRFLHHLIRQTDKWGDWHQCQSLCEWETRTNCNGKRQVVVSLCLFWYFSSVKILMNRLHVQKPSGPMGLPKPLLLGNPKYKLYMNS